MEYVNKNADGYEIIENDFVEAGTVDKDRVLLMSSEKNQEMLHSVASRILAVYNCRVFIPQSDHRSSVTDDAFKLIVLVISKDFLAEGFSYISELIEAAETNRIRILPIQAEDGVEAAFDQLFGDEHLLDLNDPDFSESLKRYLDTYVNVHHMVGISEEAAEYLNDLFPVRIFLSYRKKDREQLLACRDMIRKHEEFANAALWYDDALIPGEEFNDQIRNKLIASDIVIFIVTPSLLERDNYVMREEYPLALRENKKLLAVEMSAVDRECMKQAYPALTEPVDGRDEAAVISALQQLISDCNKQKKLITPLYQYLLARAYMEGNETELDIPYACHLLQEAAEAGQMEAMAQLAAYCYDGQYFQRNITAAKHYSEQALPLLYSRMKETGQDDLSALSLGNQVIRTAEILSMICFAQNELKRAKDLCLIELEGLDYIRNMIILSGRHNYGTVYLRMGEIAAARYSFSEAMHYYEQAEKWLKAADESIGNTITRFNLMKLYVEKASLLGTLAAGSLRYLEPSLASLRQALTIGPAIYGAEENCVLLGLNAAENMYQLAVQCEHIPNGEATAAGIYAELLRHIEKMPPRADVSDLYARTLYHAALVGQTAPDLNMLKQSHAVFSRILENQNIDDNYRTGVSQALQAVEDAIRYWPENPYHSGQNTVMDYDFGTPNGFKDFLDKQTVWEVLDTKTVPAMDFIPAGGIVPETSSDYFSEFENFQAAAYVCPHCGERLFKAVFPAGGHDPEILIGKERCQYLQPARIFASPCGRFYMAPKGNRITDGVIVYTSIIEDAKDAAQRDLFNFWCAYFDYNSDYNALRNE